MTEFTALKNRLEREKRRLERERSARKYAESILEAKALELYHANEELRQLNENLEQKIAQRTVELEKAKVAAEQFPENPKFPYSIGTLYTDLSSTPELAIPHFDKSLKMEKSSKTYFGKSLALMKMNKLDESLLTISIAIKISPEEAELYNLRGQIFHKKGNTEEVEKNREIYNSLVSNNTTVRSLHVNETKN